MSSSSFHSEFIQKWQHSLAPYKWFLTISLVIFGTFWLYPWSNGAEEIALDRGLSALSDRIYLLDAKAVLIGTVAQIVFLLIIIGISVIKPWGRRKIAAQSAVNNQS